MRRSLAAVILCAAAAVAVLQAPADAATARVSNRTWTSDAQLRAGSHTGVTVGSNRLRLTSGRTHADWTSHWVGTSYGATNVIASWEVAALPDRDRLQVFVRARRGSAVSGWKTVATWSRTDGTYHRASGGAQRDGVAWLNTDTLRATGAHTLSGYQVRVRLLRPHASSASPVVAAVHATAANYQTRSLAGVSRTTMTSTVDLAVPSYSQMTHRGQYTQWGGGGEAWCSPTSVAMVLGYYRTGPSAKDDAWVTGTDKQVAYAARYTYDYRYQGTGNWPFNTAYASLYGLQTRVARFTDLRGVEAYLKHRIPVVVSIAFSGGALHGAPITSTAGHLVVVRGFTRDGRVIVNDPAASSDSAVRHVYDRAQFERAWLGGSGGIGYVIRR